MSISLYDGKVHCSQHPVVSSKLTVLRNKDTGAKEFRSALREITFFLGFEATAHLNTKEMVVSTPISDFKGSEIVDRVVLIPIMRAGLGMVDAMQDLLPSAAVQHIGMYRMKKDLLPVCYFDAIPNGVEIDTAIILEPMIATSGSLSATIELLKSHCTPKCIKVISIIGAKAGVERLLDDHPEVELYIGAIDDELTKDGYICPGLGDAGDRQFQTKLVLRKNMKRPRDE